MTGNYLQWTTLDKAYGNPEKLQQILNMGRLCQGSFHGKTFIGFRVLHFWAIVFPIRTAPQGYLTRIFTLLRKSTFLPHFLSPLPPFEDHRTGHLYKEYSPMALCELGGQSESWQEPRMCRLESYHGHNEDNAQGTKSGWKQASEGKPSTFSCRGSIFAYLSTSPGIAQDLETQSGCMSANQTTT